MSEPARYYVTTAIDYANGPPHLGHALEKVGADVMARYHRLLGERVHFVIGTDEHGQKVAQTAAANGATPAEWTDRIVEAFQSAWRALDISNDDFIRTTEPRHRAAVEEMVRRMAERGDLYRATYAGFYCVGCEAYKSEDELVVGTCPIHPTRKVEWMEEEDWFFRLSAYQERLLMLLDRAEPPFVQPAARRNEVRRMIEEIKDISVSRSLLGWGIPWPGDPAHTVYVWIDALTNYLSATGFPDPSYRETWPAAMHVIGKDIVRFHCVYWPAMLMSANVAPPRQVWAHGFMTMGGGKLSKSSGVSFTLEEAIERHGADALRYYLMREIPWDGDGNFSWERFDERYNAELANDLGNLASRTLAMLAKYRGGTVPAAGTSTELDVQAADVQRAYRRAMDANLLHEGAAAAFRLVSLANGFIEQQAPWKLAKDPECAAELDATLASLVRSLAVSATLLSPFMPTKMRTFWERLGAPRGMPPLADLPRLDPAGWRTAPGSALFPRAEREAVS